ncbi:hypothetical protein SKAU_G00327870 [Synaphobranchus kaupii]|uniref:Uncharacterized protein n=1 Tax=Synaphobranchus kaupii TaxID=118154 RepID=A0A9Q1EQ52_SYNKA|nr:hypothetical protein SKAU_G00327870 [Synaphobranchus kaupii]
MTDVLGTRPGWWRRSTYKAPISCFLENFLACLLTPLPPSLVWARGAAPGSAPGADVEQSESTRPHSTVRAYVRTAQTRPPTPLRGPDLSLASAGGNEGLTPAVRRRGLGELDTGKHWRRPSSAVGPAPPYAREAPVKHTRARDPRPLSRASPDSRNGATKTCPGRAAATCSSSVQKSSVQLLRSAAGPFRSVR